MGRTSRSFLPASRLEILIAALLVAATLAVYSRACFYEFINYDDGAYVYENRDVLAGLSFKGLAWALTTTEMVNWHPLTWISFQVDASLIGDRPWGYHLTNSLLHAAGTALLFEALLRMTGALWRSALVAALFGLHPLHVESVAWVSERKDVLSGCFWMLTLVCYASYAARPSWPRYLSVVLVFGLGLTAKSMLVTLPFVLLLLDYWPLRRFSPLSPSGRGAGGDGSFTPSPLRGHRDSFTPSPLRGEGRGEGHPLPATRFSGAGRLLLEKLPLFALAAASSAATLVAQGARDVSSPDEPNRIATSLRAVLNYLVKTAYPDNLSVFYFYLRDKQQFWPAIAGAVVLVGITIFVLIFWRRPYLLVGWLWFLGTLVPVSGLVHILGGHAMADRYTYIPLIGIFLAVSWGFAEVVAWLNFSKLVAGAAAAGVVAACALTAWVQVGYWRDSIALWEHAVDAGGDCDLVRVNLANGLWQKGRLEEARESLLAVLKFKPSHAAAYNNLGLIAAQQGKTADAVSYYSQALRLDPDYTQAHGNLGVALLQQEKFAEAGIQFLQVLEREPANPEVRLKLEFTLLAFALKAKPEEATRYYQQLVASQPNFGRTYYFLGQALFEQGQREAGAASFRRGLELDPGWPEEARQMAWGLATHPDPRRRNGGMAVRIARQVCEAVDYRRPEMLDALAAALAETGNYEEAQRMARTALDLAAKKYTPDQLQPLKDRLSLYEKREPFRSTTPTPSASEGRSSATTPTRSASEAHSP
jgi:protein O-mannosyl-transferase